MTYIPEYGREPSDQKGPWLTIFGVLGGVVLLAIAARFYSRQAAPRAVIAQMPLPAHPFNSNLVLEVYASPADVSDWANFKYLGKTPASYPISIPPVGLWWISAYSDVDRQLLMKEIGAKKIPGLALIDANDSDLALASTHHDLRLLITANNAIDGVTDAGMSQLDPLTKLQVLILRNGRITDAGMAHLKGLTQLQNLSVEGSIHITDAGIENLKDLKEMRVLSLWQTQTRDAGLASLSEMSHLRDLDLLGTDVSDDGMEHLKSLYGLRRLDLEGTGVTGTGFADPGALAGLQSLSLEATSSTDKGLVNLSRDIPKSCGRPRQFKRRVSFHL